MFGISSTIFSSYVFRCVCCFFSDGQAEANNDLQKMISLQGALRFHGGGHLNHSIFWTNLAPPKEGGGVDPTGDLALQITKDFGSFDAFKTLMSAQSIAIQGSGWGWLGWNKQHKRLEVITKPNQDPLTEAVPLLGFDVREDSKMQCRLGEIIDMHCCFISRVTSPHAHVELFACPLCFFVLIIV